LCVFLSVDAGSDADADVDADMLRNISTEEGAMLQLTVRTASWHRRAA
jgi:hypothetical protein